MVSCYELCGKDITASIFNKAGNDPIISNGFPACMAVGYIANAANSL